VSDLDRTAVESANLAFYRALASRELARMDEVWWRDDSVSCIHPGWHRLEGWSEVRRSWEVIFVNARPWQVGCEQTRIVLAGDVAFVTCVEVIALTVADPDDGPARMQATNIFSRRDGDWRLLHHHASPWQPQGASEEESVN
jgi:ketosteroid isomerase-like protein